MSNIDTKIVELKFNNSQFESGVRQSLSSLEKLKSGLKTDQMAKGIDSVASAGKRFNLNAMGSAVEGIAKKFSTMSIVGITAITNLTNKAVNVGTNLVKSLSISPIMDGFREYETQMGSIQTILANTAKEGTNLKKVNAALDELNAYSDKTIYNFTEMAKNIGTFTAAGVKLKPATQAIKGIANLAALSGSNSQQASVAMYQLSQAMATGTVKLMDWNSVVNAGMGGAVFQDALKETARVHGVKVDEMIKKNGSFRDSLQEGWLSSKILNETLARFTGDLSASQLKSMGYSKEQIKASMKMAQTASDAATKVKTMSQLIGTLQEAAGSGWAQTWRIMFGDFEEAKTLFTNVSNVLGGFINRSSDARNDMLKTWKDLGGRKALINAIGNSFTGLTKVMGVVGKAWSEVFPPMTGKRLYGLTKGLEDFTKKLIPSKDTLEKIGRVAKGFFSVIGIGKDILGGAAGLLGRLTGRLTEGSGGFLDAAANVGDFLTNLRKSIKEGRNIERFFGRLGDILERPIDSLKNLGARIPNLFSKIDFSKFDFSKIKISISDLTESLLEFGGKAATNISKGASKVGKAISELVSNLDFTALGQGATVGLLGGLVIMVKKFTKGFFGAFSEMLGGAGGGVLDNVKDVLDGVTGSLENMQNVLRAATLLAIAAAVGILAAALIGIARVDGNDIAKSLGAISAMFAQLGIALAVFEKIAAGSKGVARLPAMALGLILMAVAVKILASAVNDLSETEWEGLAKGLTSVGVLLGALALFTKFAEVNKGGLSNGIGLILLAVAIKILASAVKDFSESSWEGLGKGLGAITGILAAVGAFSKVSNPASLLAAGLSLIGISVAMKILASAVNDFGSMDSDTIGKGLATMATALAAVGLALALIPPTSPLAASAVFVVASSLVVLAGALKLFGGMTWEEIAKGLIVLAGSLTIIAVAMNAMVTALPGAAALLVVSAALSVLAPILMAFGAMSWEAIAKGLIMLAGSLAIIGLAGLLIGPLVPALLGLGAAIALMGIGMLAAGAGLLLFSAGLAALAAGGGAAVAVLIAAVAGLSGLIPVVMHDIGMGLVEIAKVIIANAPVWTAAMVAIITSLANAVNRTAPTVIMTIVRFLYLMLSVLTRYVPQFVSKGMQLVIGILNGITANIGRLVEAAVSLIVAFINAISEQQGRLIQAGVNLIIDFVNGLASAIRNSGSQLGEAGANLATAIVEGMARGLTSGIGVIASKAREVASNALNAAKSVLGIHSPSKEFEKIGQFVIKGFALGLRGDRESVKASYDKMKTLLVDAMKSAKEDIAAYQKKLAKLKKARHKDIKAIKETTAALKEAQAEQAKATNAYKVLNSKPNQRRAEELKVLSDKYDVFTDKITNAKKVLEDATKTRDDYAKNITESFGDLPEFDANTKAIDYVKSLQKQIEEVKRFSTVIQQLRNKGLNDRLYKELLSKGTSALPFMDALLEGGTTAIKEINSLDSELTKVSTGLGKTASSELYQAAVDSAAGLVEGLKKQQDAIAKQMEIIAGTMVKSIKKALGIKSPSRAFMEVGAYSVDGLVAGLNATSGKATTVASQVGKNTVDSMRDAIRRASEELNKTDIGPRITPVVDMTDIDAKAKEISARFGDKHISINASSDGVSRAGEAVRRSRLDALNQTVGSSQTVNFTQNNTSPKALSEAEIYRQTNNALSKASDVVRTTIGDKT